MSADPTLVGTYLSKGGSALTTLAGPVAAASGPAGAALAILGALAGLAGEVLVAKPEIHKAEDPSPLVEAMKARLAARKAARS